MSYQQCVKSKNKGNVCPRGYCTTIKLFKVYPSAYANGYAASVCKGKKPDADGNTYKDKAYMSKLQKTNVKGNDLQRWFKEEWVNVCKKGTSSGGYAPCGTNHGKKYPYCRPYNKLPGTTVKTVKEITKKELRHMCKIKSGPERVYLKKTRTGK